MYQIYFILKWHCTCFGRSFCPSSGVQDCTYSNRHLSNRYCCLLASMESAVSVWLLYVQSWTPGDGRKDHQKYAQCHSKINKLDTSVRPVCFTIGIILRCTALWTSNLFLYVEWYFDCSTLEYEGTAECRDPLTQGYSVTSQKTRILIFSSPFDIYIKILLHRAHTAVSYHSGIATHLSLPGCRPCRLAVREEIPWGEALLSFETSETSRPTTAIQRHNPRDLTLPQSLDLTKHKHRLQLSQNQTACWSSSSKCFGTQIPFFGNDHRVKFKPNCRSTD